VIELLSQDFSRFQVGPLPVDFTAAGEYHYYPAQGDLGPWYDPMTGIGNRNAPWLVLEDDGRHRLLQTTTPDTNRRGPAVLVAGDDEWGDLTLTVRVQPLRADGYAGLCFRYRTSRSHYRLLFDEGRAIVLVRVNHERHDVLAQRAFAPSCEQVYELEVAVRGNRFVVRIDGEQQFEVQDDTFSKGRVALIAKTTCIYDLVQVTAPDAAHAAFVQMGDARQRELDELRERYPQPVLWKEIDTRGFGTARQVRFGHLSSRDRLDVLLAQNLKLMSSNDSLTTVRCLTAVNMEGNVLWQFGEPATGIDAGLVTADLPVQIYDIDGDGQDEVLCLKNFKLYVLDGRNGAVKNVRPLPLNPDKESTFGRLVGDAIVIANFRGLARPSDIVIKNRYRQIWALDNDLNLLWTHAFPTWQSGHFAQPYDLDGDGRDELYIGYCLLGPDGEVRWAHDWHDHTDEIAIGPFDPDRDDVQIATVCGEAGFNILAADGKVLYREMLGHAQRLSAAKFRADLPGLQFYVSTYWGSAGILSLHDCWGKRLFEVEPRSLGNVLNPVNWTGQGTELALLSGSWEHGGMLDGHGRRVVRFPDDGHPEMCGEALDLTGDARDEVVLWDMDRLCIYTQDRPFVGDRIYHPLRYPHYNASNYRAEISLPRWENEQ
jgi:hypothetical protein